MAKKATSKSVSEKANKEAAETQLEFEEVMERLEVTVKELEDGSLGLGDALKKYESGISDLKTCYEMLRTAEQKIEKLTRIGADGEVQVEPFDGDATTGPRSS